MGSFNTTCTVSKTPIIEGQKVRVFFLVMNTFDIHYDKRTKGLFSNSLMGCSCYPWDHFQLIGYPLLGTYEDYNKYEFEDKDLEALTLKAINNIYIPNKATEGIPEDRYNRYHDYMNIETISDMAQLQDMEHSGALRVESVHGVSAIVKMAIHEEIYQELILKGERPTLDYKNRKFLNFKDYINFYVTAYNKMHSKEKEIEDIEELIKYKKIMENNIGKKDENGLLITREYVEETYKSTKKLLLRQKFKLEENLFTPSGECWFTDTEVEEDIDKTGLVEKIVEAWAVGLWTKSWFFENNMEFMPSMTSGQEYNFKDSARMLNKLSSIVSKFKGRYSEDEETLSIKTETVVKSYICLNELNDKVNDWFGEGSEEEIEYINLIQDLKQRKPEYYIVGDGSKIDNFINKNEILHAEKDTKLYFNY